MNNSVRGVKTPSPVMLYMLNLSKESEFEAGILNLKQKGEQPWILQSH